MPVVGTTGRPWVATMPRSDAAGWLGLLGRALTAGMLTSLLLAVLALLGAPRAEAAATEPGLRLYGASVADVAYAPQLQTAVAIKVTGLLARVSVRQRFVNPHAAWVEGIYVFPLPQDAAVDRLRMRYDERLIEGEIQEKQQARASYEQARARGQGASLLDQQRANVFTTSVANIPPQQTVEVEIEYQQRLRWLDGEFSLRFPTVVGPRYIPGSPLTGENSGFAGRGWAIDTDQVPDASQITPPVLAGEEGNVNPLVIAAELNIGLTLAEITSPYHAIDVEQHAAGAYRVTLAAGAVPADRDFVLRWRPLLAAQPTAALFNESWQGKHYGLLMVMPPQAASATVGIARELVLVVDTSGSMHGASIRQARAALLSALRQLKPGDRFNVIQFNSGLDALFDRAMPADHEHLRRAQHYVRALHAEGGTEMLPALRLALHDPAPSGLLRQVVFLTDGAVGNEQALFETVAQGIGDSRLFTVGIGSAPNALFMTRAAKFGRGTFTYIGATDEVERKVGALFRQLSAPVLTDVRLHWQGEATAGVIQTPAQVPDLYAGEPLVVAVQAAHAPARVLIEGRLGSRRWQHTVALQGGATGDGVHALWARRLIEDWMARRVTGEDAARVRDAVLGLALEHHLVSAYTSLVAVDRTPRRPQSSDLETAALPTRLPAGWSATAVFGRLPTTATPAPMLLLLGLAGLGVAWLARRRGA